MSHHTATKPSPSTRKCRRSDTKFPGRLHDLLEYADNENLEHIVAWVMDGTAFHVRRQEEMQRLLSIFLGQKQYRSFTRQLKTWHFLQVIDGPFKGAFYHPSFQKNDKSLCNQMYQKLPLESRRSSNDDCEWTTVSSETHQSHSPNTMPMEESDLTTFLTPLHILPLDPVRTKQSSITPFWKERTCSGVSPPCMGLPSCHTMDYPAAFSEKATAVILQHFPSTDSPTGCHTGNMHDILHGMVQNNSVKESSMLRRQARSLQPPWPQLPVVGKYVEEEAHGEDHKPFNPTLCLSLPPLTPHANPAGIPSCFTSRLFPPQRGHGHLDNVASFSSSSEGRFLSPCTLPHPVVVLHHAGLLEPTPIREFGAVDSNDDNNDSTNIKMMVRDTQHQKRQQQHPHVFYHQGFSSQINDDESQFLRLVFQNQEEDQQKLQQPQQNES